jgi:Ca2+-transporting ATPase
VAIVAKGALEGILEHAKVSADERSLIEDGHARLAGAGIRVLAVAKRVGPLVANGTREEDERELSVVGLLGFGDPLRPEVPRAVAESQAAGVRIKIVTGDHALTARAIAALGANKG